MKIKSRTIVIITAYILISAVSPSTQAADPDDILIVANRDVSVNSISAAELRTFFLKQRTTWKNGDKVVPVHATDAHLKAQFLERVLGLTIPEEQTYWQEQRIMHGTSPPPEFSNNLKAVFKLKGAVSYIFRSNYRENVAKILLELPKQ
jgi:hypothetical protein